MLSIANYARPSTLEDAYALSQEKGSVILGGMLWLRLQNKKVSTAVDLCELGLDRIEDCGDCFRIGASVTLRQLETHEGLNRLTCGAMKNALSPIVGVQLRNLATVGGSVFGRFGFSDVLTLFLALGASVELYAGGTISLAQFAEMGKVNNLLTHVIVPKTPVRAVYLAQRNAAADFPVLTTAAVMRMSDGKLRCAVGARPLHAVLLPEFDLARANADGIADYAGNAADSLVFASNRRASEEYRRHLCRVLLRRAAETLRKGE